ncbi:CoA transferase [Streptomyces sp. KL116D]|uniref:CoA transferase n=1 Tax=Streptomyces sp. KL116D TaxID=3045152 RepID=UPI0035562749
MTASVIASGRTPTRFAANRDRVAHRTALNAKLESVLVDEPVAHWTALLRKPPRRARRRHPHPSARSTPRPQTAALGMVQTVDHAGVGPLQQVASPSRSAASARRSAAPRPRYWAGTAARYSPNSGTRRSEIDRLLNPSD